MSFSKDSSSPGTRLWPRHWNTWRRLRLVISSAPLSLMWQTKVSHVTPRGASCILGGRHWARVGNFSTVCRNSSRMKLAKKSWWSQMALGWSRAPWKVQTTPYLLWRMIRCRLTQICWKFWVQVFSPPRETHEIRYVRNNKASARKAVLFVSPGKTRLMVLGITSYRCLIKQFWIWSKLIVASPDCVFQCSEQFDMGPRSLQ